MARRKRIRVPSGFFGKVGKILARRISRQSQGLIRVTGVKITRKGRKLYRKKYRF